MPSTELDTFNLRDANGNDHGYTLYLHNGEEGLAVVLPLVASAAGPLARLLGQVKDIGALLEIVKAKGEGTDPNTEINIPWEQIAGDVRVSILDPNTKAVALVRDLVKHAHRDGKPLREKHEFDAAFRGNYGELFALVGRSIRANGFLSLAGIFGT